MRVTFQYQVVVVIVLGTVHVTGLATVQPAWQLDQITPHIHTAVDRVAEHLKPATHAAHMYPQKMFRTLNLKFLEKKNHELSGIAVAKVSYGEQARITF